MSTWGCSIESSPRPIGSSNPAGGWRSTWPTSGGSRTSRSTTSPQVCLPTLAFCSVARSFGRRPRLRVGRRRGGRGSRRRIRRCATSTSTSSLPQRDRPVASGRAPTPSPREQFLQATVSVWDILPESARRVGHPAPFPVELPERLIQLYTFTDDLVLDPFLGSGSTAVAAVQSGRHYVGYETDADYAALAERRIASGPRRSSHRL